MRGRLMVRAPVLIRVRSLTGALCCVLGQDTLLSKCTLSNILLSVPLPKRNGEFIAGGTLR